MLRSTPSQMWRWLSTKPGHDDHAGRVDDHRHRRPPALGRRRRSGRRRSARRTPSTSPIWGSMLSTNPFLINLRSVGTTEKSLPCRVDVGDVGVLDDVGCRASVVAPAGSCVLTSSLRSPTWNRTIPTSTRRPMIIEPSVGDSPRNGRAVMMSASRTAATVLPMNVARPPASAAPPKYSGRDAVERERAADLSVADRRAGHDEQRRDGADHAREQERSHPDPVGPDAAPLGGTLVEAHRTHLEPGSRGVQPEVEQPGADHDEDERDRDRPDARLRNDTRSSLITPWAVGRIVSEIPSRMLSVASVAISDGILTPRISTALTSPSPRPQARIDLDPDEDLERRGVGADQERADHDAEADHRPHRQVEVPDQEWRGSGPSRPAPAASPAAAPW